MKTIRTFIDEQGNVHVDFVGYAGEDCALAEEELRRTLAELGLLTHVEALRQKSPAEIAAETRTQGPPQPYRIPQGRGLGSDR